MADARFLPMNPFAHPSIPSSSAASVLTAASDHRADEAWDHFLQQSPLGQFQQTSRWAEVKALDGWNRELILIDPDQLEAGGLQLLWKATRIGRIGYVSKGPVLASEDFASIDAALVGLSARARTLRLRALILQPPDRSQIEEADLCRHQFGPHPIPSVIHATAMVNLSGGREGVLARFSHKTRQNSRTAIKNGVTVHRAGREALPKFFALMRESCHRQHEQPNPSRVELLEALWDQFSPNVSLGIASIGQIDLCGLLLIGHGERITFWKKGGTAQGNQLQANCLLMVEALAWAADTGYQTADFVSINPEIATTLLTRGELTPLQRKSQDMFKLRFTAEPKLLPPAKLLIVDPLLRQICRPFTRSKKLQSLLLRRLVAK